VSSMWFGAELHSTTQHRRWPRRDPAGAPRFSRPVIRIAPLSRRRTCGRDGDVADVLVGDVCPVVQSLFKSCRPVVLIAASREDRPVHRSPPARPSIGVQWPQVVLLDLPELPRTSTLSSEPHVLRLSAPSCLARFRSRAAGRGTPPVVVGACRSYPRCSPGRVARGTVTTAAIGGGARSYPWRPPSTLTTTFRPGTSSSEAGLRDHIRGEGARGSPVPGELKSRSRRDPPVILAQVSSIVEHTATALPALDPVCGSLASCRAGCPGAS